jgi:ATPase subunit of ABC transporter with duplicated ATPase domains
VERVAEAKARRQAMEEKKTAERKARELARKKAKEAREREKRKAKETKEKAKKAKKPKPAREKAKKAEKPKPAREKAKKAEKSKPAKMEAEKVFEPTEGVEFYRGMVTLSIVSPIYLGQLDSLKKALLEVEGLRVVMVSGAVGEGSRVLISAEEPLPLINILKRISVVEEVVRRGGEIQLRLKAG